MEKVFEAKNRLMAVLGWEDNPFVKDMRLEDREAFMKFYYPLESASILKKLAFDAKACVLLGPKGVGKTSALHYVAYSLPQDEFTSVIFKQPPESLDELALEIGIGNRGIISKITSLFSARKAKGHTRREIADKVRSFNRKVVFFVDEAHLLSNKEMYMELKYLLDEVPDLRLVLSALGRETFPDSLLQLVGEGNVFARTKFNGSEMREIIGHRISAVGGKGLEPFEDAFLQKALTEQNLLTPRYVFDELNNYLADVALDEKRMEKLEAHASTTAPAAQKAHEEKRPKVVQKATTVTEAKPAEEPKSAQDLLMEKYAHDSLVASIIAEARQKRTGKKEEHKAANAESIIYADETAAEGDGQPMPAPRQVGATASAKSETSLSFLTTMHAQWWIQLSPSQQQIMGLLLSTPDGLTLAQIMGKTGLSQNTSFNALYQLRGDDKAEIARKPEVPFPLITVKKQSVGNKKRNIYFANEKIRNLFTMT